MRTKHVGENMGSSGHLPLTHSLGRVFSAALLTSMEGGLDRLAKVGAVHSARHPTICSTDCLS